MSESEMKPTTEASTELHFAKRYAELGEWQQMYHHLWNAMLTVPDDTRVGWNYEVRPHNASTLGNGVGVAPNPLEQFQSVLYEYNDMGVDQFSLEPAGWDDE
jgi:hypothetical protein